MKSRTVFFLSIYVIVTGIEKFSLDECGRERGCWSFPPDCESESCDGLVRWNLNGTDLMLEFQAKDINLPEMGRYIAVGFSNDSYMGNDTVFECVFDENGIGRAYISHNEAVYNFQLLNASQEMIFRSASAIKDGFMLCEMEIDLAAKDRAEEKNLIHDLLSDSWRLLFVRGLAMPGTGEKVMHSLNPDEMFPRSTINEIMLCADCPQKFQAIDKQQ